MFAFHSIKFSLIKMIQDKLRELMMGHYNLNREPIFKVYLSTELKIYLN